MGEFRRAWPQVARPVGRAELLARGVSRRALDGPRFRRTSHGLYVPSSTERTPAQRIAEAAALLPYGAAVAGWAAAYVCGVDWLDGRHGTTGDRLPVQVLLPPASHRRSTADVAYERATLSAAETRVVLGLPITAPARTAYDVARTAPDLVEAVVALDALLAARLVTPGLLAEVASSRDGCRGARQLRRAVALAQRHVRSPWESRLRMCYVLELGLPLPEVNRPVFDRDGRFLGAPDLLDVAAGLAMEFDGQGHRHRAQHRLDNVREEGFEQVGLVVVRVDSLDLTRHRPQLRRRLLAGRALALGRDRTRDAWTIQEPSHWLGMPA